ncbi:hypothetical protein evm_010244 [Chilo suppressalis]|nr:hypothetical protein evm_010244 [Chilo suppressalis]
MGNRSIKKNKRKRARLRELREHMINIRVQRQKKYYLYGTTGTFSNLAHTADILESNENDGTLNDSEKNTSGFGFTSNPNKYSQYSEFKL